MRYKWLISLLAVGIILAIFQQDIKDVLPSSLSNNFDEGGTSFRAFSPPFTDYGKCGEIKFKGEPAIKDAEKIYCDNGNTACDTIGKKCEKIQFKREGSLFWKVSKFNCECKLPRAKALSVLSCKINNSFLHTLNKFRG
ncbi:MAG: hypothetical protein KKD18_06225 [Nanoarchaeota archaeon]|nr:hypothetical protein [Nanoarchaeota archaeon]